MKNRFLTIKLSKKQVSLIKAFLLKHIEVIKESVVGKAAIHDWNPNKVGSFMQIDEIIYNRFYRLADAIMAEWGEEWLTILVLEKE